MRLKPWPLVGLLAATATASYLCRVNVSVVGALLMDEFGLSQPAMGRVFSAFVLGYALAQIPAGMLVDRWGVRRVLLWAALCWIAMTAIQTLVGLGAAVKSPAAALTALLVLRFALGVTEAPTFPAAGQAVSRWIPKNAQGRANGFVLGAIALGSAIAPPFLSVIMVRFGWRRALLVSAAPAAAVAFVWLQLRETIAAPAADVRSPREKNRFAVFSSPSFALLTASYTLQGYVGYVFVFWFYLYLVQERHFSLLTGGLLGALPWTLSLVSIPIGGFISDRLVVSGLGRRRGRRIVPMVGLAGAGGCTIAGAATANPYVAAIALALATALVLSVEGPFWATMMDIEPTRTGTAGGVMNMGSNIGGFISPALTPMIAASAGWNTALFVTAGLAFVAAVMWLGIATEPAAAAYEKIPSAR